MGAAVLQAQSVSIVAPTAGQAISGYSGTSFAVSLSSASSVDRVCYQVDAYRAFNPGFGSPYNSSLANDYVNGCSRFAPYAMPWNSYWVADGPHQLIATAYDSLGNVVATSSAVSFTVANLWPVSCAGSAPSYTVTTSQPLSAAISGVVNVTATATGPCASDSKTISGFIDGISVGSVLSTTSTAVTLPFDTRIVQDGTHVLALNVTDNTNGSSIVPAAGNSYQGAAGEWSATVTFANTTTPVEVRNAAHEVYIAPGGTANLACTLLEANGTAVSSPTCDYESTNTSVATVNSSGLVTAVANGNANISTMAETGGGSDGALYSGITNSLTSSTYTFTSTDVNELLNLKSGTGCTPGLYQIQAVNTSANLIILTSAVTSGSSCAGATFALGPTRQAWVFVWPTNTLPYFGSDGTIQTSPGYSKTMFINEFFSSGSCLGDVFYSPGCLSDFASSGANVMEFGLDYGIDPSTLTSGGQSGFQTTQTNYVNGIESSISAYPWIRAYLTGDNFWRSPSSIWGSTQGAAITTPWTTQPLTYAAASWVGLGLLLGEADEGAAITSAPLQGPLTLAAAGTAQNWLGGGSIIASNGSCTINGTSPATLGELGYFIVTNSVTSGMNSALGTSQYRGTVNGNTVTFACASVANGIYNHANDPNLTIQPLGLNYYHDSTSTGFINYNALQVMTSQLQAVPGMYPFAMNVAAGTNCANIAGWSNGTQTLAGVTQAGTYADLYTSNGFEQYLMSRISSYSIINPLNSVGMGVETRQHYGCFNPSNPLVLLTASTFTGYGTNGYPVSIASQANNVITFTGPHNIQNVVPGARLVITGGSNPTFNTNYYIVGIPSPTQLRVEYATGTIPGTGTGTIVATFSPSGYTENIGSGLSEPSTPSLASSGAGFGVMFGGRFFLNSADSNLPRHRGETVTFTGVTSGQTGFNSTSFLYLPFQPSTPSKFNAILEIPSGSSTGGTAYIVPDNAYVAGRNLASEFAANQPAYTFATAVECVILRCAGQRLYKLGGAIGMSSDASGGFVGLFESAATDFTDITSNNAEGQLFSFPYWENGAAVPLFHAGGDAGRWFTARQSFILQPTLPSPDLGNGIDCSARSGAFGAILLCINLTEGPRTITPALSPYLQAGQQIIRDMANWQNITTTVLGAGTSSNTVTLQPDDAVSYIFPANFANSIQQPVISARLSERPRRRRDCGALQL